MKKLPFEPFKIKVVEPVPITTRKTRKRKLMEAHYNPFALKAGDVTIDLLTDSGTSAMSHTQWGALMIGDESYAGSDSFFRFEKAVQEVTGYSHVIPTHQGRSAENLFFSAMLKPGDVVPNNTHFDTTEANVIYKKGKAISLPSIYAKTIDSDYPFKGNMNLEALEDVLKKKGKKIPLVMMTVTNNSVGGQPVSMENLKAVRGLCKKYKKPLYLDCARFAENCLFIKKREKGYGKKSVKTIAGEMFSLADGALMSAKKDALVNIGGFLATNDKELAAHVAQIMVVIEGFVTYGGLAGRDMDAIATGLLEGLDESYLLSRVRQVEYLGDRLMARNVPVLTPTGGHAVYIDAKGFLPHLPQSKFPGWTLSCEAYIEGGVRSCEIGTVMFAKENAKTGKVAYPELDLVRLAVPRRVYTDNHMDYVADAFGKLVKKSKTIKGVKFSYKPKKLRHFLSRFKPL